MSAWIQTNLYLALADAPFDKEDPTLNPAAGACVTCPRRSGFNTFLFADVQGHGDQCLAAPCFHTKVNNSIDREITANPEFVQIENGYRSPREQKPGAVQRGHFREIDQTAENPDAEPVCPSARTAIIVYGKRVGTKLTVCIDDHCPVHDPRAAARQAAEPAPPIAPAPAAETEDGAQQRQTEYKQHRKKYEEEQQRSAEKRRQQDEREEQEQETEQARREELRKRREATFKRILENAPATFTAAQLRILLRALVNLDPYSFVDDLAEELADENDKRGTEEVLLSAIDSTADDKLTRFAIRLALAGHVGIPCENDFLTEAEAVFAPQPPKKTKKPKPIQANQPTAKKAKKKIAA